MQQKPSSEKSRARAGESKSPAPVIGDTKPRNFLPEGGLPLRAFRKREIHPIAKNVHGKKHTKKAHAKELNHLRGCRARMDLFNKLLRNSRRDRLERNYHAHEQSENCEIQYGGEESRPKIGVRSVLQRGGVRS
jgi:hypothetical protein